MARSCGEGCRKLDMWCVMFWSNKLDSACLVFVCVGGNGFVQVTSFDREG